MSQFPEDALVRCPYYRYDSGGCIFCEGISQVSTLRLSFHSPSERLIHKKAYCHSRWTGCGIAQMQNARYDYQP